MFEHRCGIKLKSDIPAAAALKLLRKRFPDTSLGELRRKIQAHDYVYLSDSRQADWEREMVEMLGELDRAGLAAELYEETRDAPGPWQTAPLSREVLGSLLRRSGEIRRQVLEDVERETEGWISPEAAALIDGELREEALDREAAERAGLPFDGQ